MADVDPFAEFGAKADADDPFAEFGVKADAPAPAAPVAAAPAPAPLSFSEKMTSLGRESAKAAFEPIQDIGRGLISGAPFDLGPKAVAALESVGDKTYEEALTDERTKIAESKARSPYLFGGGELVSEFGTLRGVGKGAASLGKAAGRVAPVAKTVAELAAESAAMGAYGATEAAARGEDVGTAALTTAALPGVGRFGGFLAQKALPAAEAGLIEKGIRYPLAGAAAVATPAALAYESYPANGSTSDKVKWLVTQGLVGRDVAGQAFGAAKGAAAKKLEPLQSRAVQEAEGLVRQKVYEPEATRLAGQETQIAKTAQARAAEGTRLQSLEQSQAAGADVEQAKAQRREQVRAIEEKLAGEMKTQRLNDLSEVETLSSMKRDVATKARLDAIETAQKQENVAELSRLSTKANSVFQKQVKAEQRVIREASRIAAGDTAELGALESEISELNDYVGKLNANDDPQLRGMAAKKFQDTRHRLATLGDIYQSRGITPPPEYGRALDRVEKSYIDNSDKWLALGETDPIIEDPVAWTERQRERLIREAGQQLSAAQEEKLRLAGRIVARDYAAEARASLEGPIVPEARLKELAEEQGLTYSSEPVIQQGRPVELPLTRGGYPSKQTTARSTEMLRRYQSEQTNAIPLEEMVAELRRKKLERPTATERRREAFAPMREPIPSKGQRIAERKLEEARAKFNAPPVEPEPITGKTPQQTALEQLTAERPAALEPAVQARMAQELAAARRTVGGLSPTTVQPGERPSGILEPSTGRILYETLFPEEARPFVSLRRFMPGTGGGAVRVTEPKRSLPEYSSVREGEIPTETRLERPLQLQALTDSWLRMLRTERDPRTPIERFARGVGKTVDEFVSTPSLALESLKLALQEHEATKDQKAQEEEAIQRYLDGVTP